MSMKKEFTVEEDEMNRMEQVKQLFSELYEMREDMHVVRVDNYAYVVLEWFCNKKGQNEFDSVTTFFKAKDMYDWMLAEVSFCLADKNLRKQGVIEYDKKYEYMDILLKNKDTELYKRHKWYEEQWEKIAKN